jgi:hypothetical protein
MGAEMKKVRFPACDMWIGKRLTCKNNCAWCDWRWDCESADERIEKAMIRLYVPKKRPEFSVKQTAIA